MLEELIWGQTCTLLGTFWGGIISSNMYIISSNTGPNLASKCAQFGINVCTFWCHFGPLVGRYNVHVGRINLVMLEDLFGVQQCTLWGTFCGGIISSNMYIISSNMGPNLASPCAQNVHKQCTNIGHCGSRVGRYNVHVGRFNLVVLEDLFGYQQCTLWGPFGVCTISSNMYIISSNTVPKMTPTCAQNVHKLCTKLNVFLANRSANLRVRVSRDVGRLGPHTEAPHCW